MPPRQQQQAEEAATAPRPRRQQQPAQEPQRSLRRLEEAGYISCKKGFEGRVPRTEYELTPEGRMALEKYLDHLEAIVGAMRPRSV